MGESLMERRRVQEEGLRIVNCFSTRESLCSSRGHLAMTTKIRTEYQSTKIRN
jgi:hypothetical protein